MVLQFLLKSTVFILVLTASLADNDTKNDEEIDTGNNTENDPEETETDLDEDTENGQEEEEKDTDQEEDTVYDQEEDTVYDQEEDTENGQEEDTENSQEEDTENGQEEDTENSQEEDTEYGQEEKDAANHQEVDTEDNPQNVSENIEYKYFIPYENSMKDFPEIIPPKSGLEIPQMNVSMMKKPNQIRLSYTGDPTEMALSWNTNSVSHHEQVNYGLLESDLNYTAYSISHQFAWHWVPEDGDYAYVSGYIHECLMVNLIPGRIHFYQVGLANF